MTDKSLMKYLKITNSDKMTLNDQAFVFATLVDLMEMGISIRKSVEFIKIMRPSIGKPMTKVIEELRLGKSFSTAFRPYVSTNTYYQLEIADQHGGLVQTLASIAKIFASQNQQRKKLRSLIQYPIFLLAFLGFMMLGMRIYIMPELASWNTGTQSFRSQFIKIGIAIIVIGMIGVGIYQWMRFKQTSITNQVNLLCRLPLFGPLYRTYCHYYLTANLAFFVGSGMSVGSICKYLTRLDSQSLLFQIGRKVENSLASGQAVSKVIDNAVYLPTELNLLIQKGSKKATLSKEVYALSMIKYKVLVQKIERLIVIVQPILFGVIGLVIVVMYLNLLMPMYNSMKEVSR
jgi:competence protein ComGB